MSFSRLVLLLIVMSCQTMVSAELSMDQLDEAMSMRSNRGEFQADLSVLADMEFYLPETPSPGLLFPDDSVWYNPRLAIFFDATIESRVGLHGQMRVDRGFDPGSVPAGDVRLDEYFVRVAPMADDRIAIKVGKFATVFGNWASKNLSWDNPFVTAPLIYEDVLSVSDANIPIHPQALTGRRRVADKKSDWVTAIWGPSYASGVSVSGRIEKLDYAIELKNAALSSRPSEWDITQRGFDHPTVSARIGVRPAPEWAIGTSFSQGSYTLESVGVFPDQTTYGVDASFQHHYLQIWSEVIYTQFEIPGLSDADAAFYYIEARYKLTPQMWAALRWNQSIFGSVQDGLGGFTAWDRNAWRLDLSLGWRFNRHLQAKIQGSLGGREGDEAQGNHLLAAQVTLKF